MGDMAYLSNGKWTEYPMLVYPVIRTGYAYRADWRHAGSYNLEHVYMQYGHSPL